MKHLFLAACIALLVLTPALAFAQARSVPAGASSSGTAVARGDAGGASGGNSGGAPSGGGGTGGGYSSAGGSNGSGGGAIGRGDSYAGSRSFGTGPAGYNAPRGIDRENGPRSGESFATPRSSDYSRPEARGGYANVRGAAPAVGQPVPGQTRPRGDGPTIGQAVPRGSVNPKPPDNGGYYPPDYWSGFGNAGWWAFYGYGYYWGACYWNSWSCGWGPYWGWEPYWYYQWYSPWSVWDDWSQMGYAYGGGSYMNEGMGGIRFKVKPKEAEIWADGYFEGQVTDYGGGKGLQLKAGMHHIEIKAKGYETITVDLRAMPGKTVTYTGEMKPAPK